MKKKKISFLATKRVVMPIKVSFKSKGKRVSFQATKRIYKPIKITFYVKKRKRR